MLQREDTPAVVNALGGEGPPEPTARDIITNFLSLARRQYLAIALFAGVGLVLGFLYLLLTPRVYVAQAELLVERGMRPTVTQQTVLAEAPFDASFFESQIKIIESERLAREVVRKLQLQRYDEFSAPIGPFGAFQSLLTWRELSQSELEDRAVTAFLSRVSAKRVGVSFFIEISFEANDAALAESIVNTLGETYIADRIGSRVENARKANEWLKGRLDELRRQSSVDEQAVNTYKAEKNIVSAGGTLVGDQSLTALNSELVAARIKTAEAAARLERIQAVLRADNPDASVDATVSDALSSPIIIKLRQDYLSYVTKMNEYSARYGSRHLAVVALRNKARSAKAAIASELRRLAESSRSDYLISKSREAEIERQRSRLITESQATGRAQVTLRELESAAQSSRALYNAFEQKFMELTQEQSLLFDEARLATKASVTNKSRAPKVLALSLFAGLLTGVAVAALREFSNRVFRTSGEVERALRAPCVAVIPFSEDLNQKGQTAPADAQPAMTFSDSPEMRLIKNLRGSHYAESIRALILAVDQNIKKIPRTLGSSTIGVTSSLPSEGKSTNALALALLMATLGRRVILVDGDSRNASLSRRFTPGAARGLIDAVTGKCSLDEAIFIDPESNLSFLPALVSQSFDAAEKLATPSARNLFNALEERYDYVVVDLPPLLPLIDVQATTSLIDFYFLIVEWGQTRVDVVQHALHLGKVIFDRLAGVVLNKADPNSPSWYGYYGYHYYDDKGED
jgi:succinoglycan biosynthesis transport protein ExoP